MLATAQANIAAELLRFDRPADAEPILRECLAIRLEKETDAWSTFNTKFLLGSALLAQKKAANAEPLLVAGYEGMEQRRSNISPRLRKLLVTEPLERLVRLYEIMDNKEKADEWRERLEKSKTFKSGK
jgi:hypothetical protein